MKSDVKAGVTRVRDRRDVHCLMPRGVLNLSCKKRAAVRFLLLLAACQGEQVSTDENISLCNPQTGAYGFPLQIYISLAALFSWPEVQQRAGGRALVAFIVSDVGRTRSVNTHPGTRTQNQKPHLLLWRTNSVSWHCVALAVQLLSVLQPQVVAGTAHQHLWHARARMGSTSAHAVATVIASAWNFRAKNVSFLSGMKEVI